MINLNTYPTVREMLLGKAQTQPRSFVHSGKHLCPTSRDLTRVVKLLMGAEAELVVEESVGGLLIRPLTPEEVLSHGIHATICKYEEALQREGVA